MKKFARKRIISILLILSFVFQNTNFFYAIDNTKAKGSIEEENVIVDDDIEAIYNDC